MVHPRLRTEAFWRWLYESLEADEPATDAWEVTWSVPSGEGLRVVIAEGREATLFDRRSAAQLGWVDGHHWHPHALRVAEVCSVAEGQAAGEARDACLLMLGRFAVATTADELDQLGSTLELAWRGFGFFGALPEFVSFADGSVSWQQHDGRWSLIGEDPALYTLRRAENADFPMWLSAIPQAEEAG